MTRHEGCKFTNLVFVQSIYGSNIELVCGQSTAVCLEVN